MHIYGYNIYICIDIEEIYLNLKKKSFSNGALKLCFRKFQVYYNLDLAKIENWTTAAYVVAETLLKLLNKNVLRTGEPCTCECEYLISQRYIKYILVYSSKLFAYQILQGGYNNVNFLMADMRQSSAFQCYKKSVH